MITRRLLAVLLFLLLRGAVPADTVTLSHETIAKGVLISRIERDSSGKLILHGQQVINDVAEGESFPIELEWVRKLVLHEANRHVSNALGRPAKITLTSGAVTDGVIIESITVVDGAGTVFFRMPGTGLGGESLRAGLDQVSLIDFVNVTPVATPAPVDPAVPPGGSAFPPSGGAQFPPASAPAGGSPFPPPTGGSPFPPATGGSVFPPPATPEANPFPPIDSASSAGPFDSDAAESGSIDEPEEDWEEDGDYQPSGPLGRLESLDGQSNFGVLTGISDMLNGPGKALYWLGLIASAIGHLWCWGLMWKEGPLWGLSQFCCIGTPVWLIFVARNWSEAKIPFLIEVSGFVLTILGMVVGGFFS